MTTTNNADRDADMGISLYIKHGGGEDIVDSLDSFLWHNRDSLTPSEISDLRNLKIGDAIHYGGGAAEESSVTRISAAAASAWWGDGTIDFGEIA